LQHPHFRLQSLRDERVVRRYEANVFTPRLSHTAVQGAGDSLILLPEVARQWREGSHHLGGVVGGAVVHDHDFEVVVRLAGDALQAGTQQVRPIVGGHHNAHFRHGG
jgi:hypothetical protein